MVSHSLVIDGYSLHSRLFVGTGKFSSFEMMNETLAEAQCDLVTMALRRINLSNPADPLLNSLNRKKYKLLPNTSGARNAEEAIRLAKLIKTSGISSWIKLEVIPDSRYLFPDHNETLKAAEILVKEGFKVFPYIQPDPLLAKQLEEVGCSVVMPLAAPIGTNRGMKSRDLIQYILHKVSIPVIVDAGLGLPSHACEAMEMGVDAVMVNTAIATATNPPLMAKAFANAVQAGRLAYLSGKSPMKEEAVASSPLTGFLYH